MNGLLGLLAVSAAFAVLGSVVKGILRPISWAMLAVALVLGSKQIGSASGFANVFGENFNAATIGLQNVADPLAAQIVAQLKAQAAQPSPQPSASPSSPQPAAPESPAPESPAVSASPTSEPSPSPIGGLW